MAKSQNASAAAVEAFLARGGRVQSVMEGERVRTEREHYMESIGVRTAPTYEAKLADFNKSSDWMNEQQYSVAREMFEDSCR